MTTKGAIVTGAAVVVLGFGVLGAVAVTNGASKEQPAYKSSIQVTDQNGGRRGEGREERGERHRESAEVARLAPLVKVDVCQATAAALGRVPGTALGTSLENENGNLVYGVEIRTAAGQVNDVKVDAGTGAVLHVEVAGADAHEDEDDE